VYSSAAFVVLYSRACALSAVKALLSSRTPSSDEIIG
jgi:hypothetical protein